MLLEAKEKPYSSTGRGRRSPIRQLGFSLIELMIVLGIIGSAMGLVLWYQGRAEQSQNVQAQAGDFTVLLGKIRSMYGGSTNGYTGLTWEVLNQSGLLGGSLRYDTTAKTVSDRWGQAVTLSTTQTSFAFIFGGTNRMTNESCMDFVMRLAQSADEVMVGGTITVTSGSLSGGTGATALKNATTALSATALAARCASSANRQIGLLFSGG